ncbi:MAG: AAA family ATPase [Pseudomonadota bacterium]
MDRIFPKSLQKRWVDPKGLIQVFTGPRQVGKTTAAIKLMDKQVAVYASADLPTPPTTDFIEEHWIKARRIPNEQRTVILDEVQKIPRWSEVVKSLWDEDQRDGLTMRVCLLGSSSILIEKGLSESLTGRFEVNYFPHWTYSECHKCFNITLDDYIELGGYPKSYDFIDDRERLENYIQNSILEPTLGRDILVLHSVDKPALLRQLFWYVSRMPAQIVSYEKILSHLQGRGNSATLVHYADLLSKAFLLCPLSKYSKRTHRTKRSIPKWILPNSALIESSVKKVGVSGFVFENLVGSHILNLIYGHKEFDLQFWREDKWEVDFVLSKYNEPLVALEAKSGRVKKMPDVEMLKKKGISCPVEVISKDNIDAFLNTSSVEDIIDFL